MRALLFVAALAVMACGPATPPMAQPQQPQQQQQQQQGQQQMELLPDPFTPQQIAAAMPVGTVIRYRFESQQDGAVEETWKVLQVTTAGMTLEATKLKQDGTSETQTDTPTWEQFANQGGLPKQLTVITDSEATTPAGTFKTRLYTITHNTAVTRLHFAMDLPGPPVLLEMEDAGKRMLTMTLLSREPRPQAAAPQPQPQQPPPS